MRPRVCLRKLCHWLWRRVRAPHAGSEVLVVLCCTLCSARVQFFAYFAVKIFRLPAVAAVLCFACFIRYSIWMKTEKVTPQNLETENLKITVCFTGGGTGGHIYPGLAVASFLRQRFAQASERLEIAENAELRIVWLGNSSGMDKTLVEKSGIADVFVGIPSGKLRRYFSFATVADIFKIFAGFIAAFFALAKYKPAVLFSKGGYVSVPPCFAARFLHIPVFTHECDFSPGLATRLNAKTAEKICVSYAQSAAFFSSSLQKKIIVTGNPVRQEFYSLQNKKTADAKPNKPLLLVIGGSLGAMQINELVAKNLDWLCERFRIVHQTGNNFDIAHYVDDAQNLAKKYPDYRAESFIYSGMSELIASSDIVLSRAGANSIWECAALAKPLVLIPLAGSGTRGDQIENAHFFEKAGCALVIDGTSATADALKAALTKMLGDNAEDGQKLRLTFSENMRVLCAGKIPAADIAQIIFDRIFVR
ncbi:MAG: undecaprenyldiphospho-muramoylpentapeptide beta-N-acetylglucosaminyltransferase [Treponemataceae bacterium]|nr:MAG: undecaprenyldiphospho-muramoylpentapeptide beta-N-acetylglucosaminyltransferase [Treponemataceae bacterium]